MRRTVTGCLYVACHSWKDCWENEGWLEALTIWGHRLFPPLSHERRKQEGNKKRIINLISLLSSPVRLSVLLPLRSVEARRTELFLRVGVRQVDQDKRKSIVLWYAMKDIMVELVVPRNPERSRWRGKRRPGTPAHGVIHSHSHVIPLRSRRRSAGRMEGGTTDTHIIISFITFLLSLRSGREVMGKDSNVPTSVSWYNSLILATVIKEISTL